MPNRMDSDLQVCCSGKPGAWAPTHSRAKHKGDLAACGMLDAVKWRQDRHDTHTRFVF